MELGLKSLVVFCLRIEIQKGVNATLLMTELMIEILSHFKEVRHSN